MMRTAVISLAATRSLKTGKVLAISRKTTNTSPN